MTANLYWSEGLFSVLLNNAHRLIDNARILLQTVNRNCLKFV